MSHAPNLPARSGANALFVDRPVATLMAILAILLIGAVAVDRLPLRFLPSGLGTNEINIWVNVPVSMAPQEVHDKVAEPLVEMLRTSIPSTCSRILRTATSICAVRNPGHLICQSPHRRFEWWWLVNRRFRDSRTRPNSRFRGNWNSS